MHVPDSNRLALLSRICDKKPFLDWLSQLAGHTDMGYLFKAPEKFYSQGYPEHPGFWPGLESRALLPLWEHSGAVYAADISRTPVEFLMFYLEAPTTPVIIGKSIVSAIFRMMSLHVWEYGGGAIEVRQAVEFWQSMGLPRLPEFTALISNPAASEEEEAAYLRIIETEAQPILPPDLSRQVAPGR